MLLIIIILGAIAALFCALLETDVWLSSRQSILNQFYKQLFAAATAPVIFIVIYTYKHFTLLILISGLVFIFISFVYLGIISSAKKIKYHFSIYFISICSISAMSGLDWIESILGPFSFLIFLLFFLTISQKLSTVKGKNRENMNELLELFGILNGIFIFILGFAIASDEMKFFKRIVNLFYN